MTRLSQQQKKGIASGLHGRIVTQSKPSKTRFSPFWRDLFGTRTLALAPPVPILSNFKLAHGSMKPQLFDRNFLKNLRISYVLGEWEHFIPYLEFPFSTLPAGLDNLDKQESVRSLLDNLAETVCTLRQSAAHFHLPCALEAAVAQVLLCKDAIARTKAADTIDSWNEEEFAQFERQLSEFNHILSWVSSLNPESVLKELRDIAIDTAESKATAYQLELASFCTECLVEYAKWVDYFTIAYTLIHLFYFIQDLAKKGFEQMR